VRSQGQGSAPVAKGGTPIHERLYEAHTAAFGQSLKPAETSDLASNPTP
jgi:hypothetical protein